MTVTTITKTQAIASLCPNSDFVAVDDVVTEWLDLNCTQPSDSEINAEIARLQAEYVAIQYQRDRVQAYPSIADQLDTLYHQGYDGWKATIEAVKTEFPKP